MAPSRERMFRLLAVLLLLLYACGLAWDLGKPWVGMHDWNGAFFSQLARNLIRYPASVHHGMAIVAVGEDVPSAGERSIYATHPPGLVWLVAGAFTILRESEATARAVPILFSIISLAFFIGLARRAYGWATALVAGALYSLMPVLVYFGRMVDHEAVCLACMLVAAMTWTIIADGNSKPAQRRIAMASWMAAMLVGVWVDWSMVLFAGLFCAYLIFLLIKGQVASGKVFPGNSTSPEKPDHKIRLSFILICIGWVVLCVASMIVYLVEAGLGGRWGDLVAIFVSRSTEAQGGALGRDMAASGGVGQYTTDNLTWPVIVLACMGIVAIIASCHRRRSMTTPAIETISCRPSAAGLFLVTLTGVIWLLVFWRQYERHNYWLFYLGPTAALLAGKAVVALWSRMSVYGRPLAWTIAGLIVATTAFIEFRGVQDYFGRLSYPPAEVEAWKAIHAMTRRGDRVLLFRNPLRIEDRGGYHFRNIVPPHLAYYLDRPFDVEADFRKIPQLATTHPVFVMPISDAMRYARAVSAMEGVFRVYHIGNQQVVSFQDR